MLGRGTSLSIATFRDTDGNKFAAYCFGGKIDVIEQVHG
jgi:hypothetical protein